MRLTSSKTIFEDMLYLGYAKYEYQVNNIKYSKHLEAMASSVNPDQTAPGAV